MTIIYTARNAVLVNLQIKSSLILVNTREPILVKARDLLVIVLVYHLAVTQNKHHV